MSTSTKSASAQRVSYSAFMKRNPSTVVHHFQPETVTVADTPQELKRWENLMRDKVGLPPLQAGDSGQETITFTTSSSGVRYADDCDYDPYPECDP